MSLGIYPFLFFLIALPGIIFRRFYYQGEFSKQFYPKQVVISLFYSFIIGVCVIYLSFFLYNNIITNISSLSVISKEKIKSFLLKIFSDKSSSIDLLDYLFNSSFMLKFIIISAIIILISWFLAIIFYKIVRQLKLDINIKSLSFDNHWYYYFRGEFLRFKNFRVKYKTIDIVTADVLTRVDDSKVILYRGIVKQYYLNQNSHNIETLILSDVTKEDESGKNSKQIPGNCFIVPFNTVININLKVLYTVYENSRINTFIKKYKGFLVLIFFLVPYILLFTPLKQHVDYPIIAVIIFSLIFMAFPIVIEMMTDNEKKKNWWIFLIAYVINLVLFILLYQVIKLVVNLFS